MAKRTIKKTELVYRAFTEENFFSNEWDFYLRNNLFHTAHINAFSKHESCYKSEEKAREKELDAKIIVYTVLYWLEKVISEIEAIKHWSEPEACPVKTVNPSRISDVFKKVQDTMRPLVECSKNQELRVRITDLLQDAPDDFFFCPNAIALPAIEAFHDLVHQLSYDEIELEVEVDENAAEQQETEIAVKCE